MPLGIGLGGLALLALAMFFDALVAPGSRVLGQVQDDLALHFLWWREFGFGELAAWLVAGFALLRRKRGERGA